MITHDRDKVISAAKEAGFIYYGEFPQDYKCKIESLYTIAFEAGRVAEREECAKIIEKQDVDPAFKHRMAFSIRSRSTK